MSRVLQVLLALCLLAVCSSSASAQIPSPFDDPGAPKSNSRPAPPSVPAPPSDKAFVLFRIGQTVEDPRSSIVRLGKEAGKGYKVVQVVTQRRGAKDEHLVAKVQLDPGEYHVLSWQGDGEILGRAKGGVYENSLASFKVGPREVVDLGSVTMLFVAPKVVQLVVGDLPKPLLDAFRAERPDLAPLLQTRHMEISPMRLSGQALQDYCRKIGELTLNWRLSLPPECILASTPAPGNPVSDTTNFCQALENSPTRSGAPLPPYCH